MNFKKNFHGTLQSSSSEELTNVKDKCHSLSEGSSSAMDCVTNKSIDEEPSCTDSEPSAAVKLLGDDEPSTSKQPSKLPGIRLRKTTRPIRGRPGLSTPELHK